MTGFRVRFPHPAILLLGCVLVAALLTHLLPAGQYARQDDPATGRQIVVPGTYHPVAPAPVGLFQAFVAVPRGLVAASEVIVLVLLVGGAWTVIDRAGTLGHLVNWTARRLSSRPGLVITALSVLFGLGGALENMQEEIIPLIPVLLVLAGSLGFDALTMVAVSAGAAAVGSAFSPLNPFQAGLALKLAQLPLLSYAGLRLAMMALGLMCWIGWTIRHVRRAPVPAPLTQPAQADAQTFGGRHLVIVALVAAPFIAYIIGVTRYAWGFNELSAAFLVAGCAVGVVGGLGGLGTVEAYFDGIRSVAGAAVLVGLARAISLVLDDGRVIDTILYHLVSPLASSPRSLAAVLMAPLHGLIHVAVPSVSGQAVLTMPVMVPMADLLQISRQSAVLAYQTGAGLTEMLTPTNGALMAILLAAGVTYGRWIRFVVPITLLLAAIGVAGILLTLGGGGAA